MALDVQLESGVNLVFATPVMIRKIADVDLVNSGLRQAILEAEAKDTGLPGSNVGGWQSKPVCLQWPIPEIATLKGWVEDAVVHMACLPNEDATHIEYTAVAWANVIRNGDYNRTHNHGDIHWSCVYYVDCGEPEAGHPMNGRIELRDPRPGANIAGELRYPGYTFGEGLLLDPEPGMLLMFPGWIEHFVHPFFGNGERISIAVNVTVSSVDGVKLLANTMSG
ncbi:MAG: putative 2OG-Fe(II) oxygenase [Acidiferrobacterales bacterium]